MKYQHVFNSDTTLYEKKYDIDQEITILFEKENIILQADAQGNAVFFDTDGNEIQSGKAESNKRFGFIFCIVNKSGITVRFPITETIDHYPNCDGEYDRYSERIIDNIIITCPVKLRR